VGVGSGVGVGVEVGVGVSTGAGEGGLAGRDPVPQSVITSAARAAIPTQTSQRLAIKVAGPDSNRGRRDL
jgi:hypothetical protein